MRASLPSLDGEVSATALAHPATLERDALGVVTIEAADRVDLAYATGYAHAQDRFFQMDLSRRLAAGELTPLFGEAAAAQDAKARVFHFRIVARKVLEQATNTQRALVEAYARGVNAGLASLRSRPWEYWMFRAKPEEWRPEDTVLVVHAMWWDLQYGDLAREQLRHEIDARLGGPQTQWGWKRATCFFYPPRSQWDAPNRAGDGASEQPFTECAAVPSKDELDVRSATVQVGTSDVQGIESAPIFASTGSANASEVGSNNWALAGNLTASGGALVASDMHLGLRIPTVWYRMRLRAPGLDLNGLTLPGAPVLVAGSNGAIAWSFSNSYGDWLDVEHRACDAPGRGLRYEGPDEQGRCGFVSWLAALPEATNMRLLDFETARSTADAVALAPEIGIPHQNLIVGDRAGHIAWTVIGRVPQGMGADRNAGVSGWLTASEQPRIVDPPGGRLWSANALATEDPQQERMIGGDETGLGAGYDPGARARQIRGDLEALSGGAREADMLAIQLDDRAVFLKRWRDLALDLLDEAALRNQPERLELKRLLANWEGHAAVDSVAYRLAREYRDHVEARVWRMILQALALPAVDAAPPARFEHPLWTLVTRQPIHLLAPSYADWRSFLLSQVDATISDAKAACGSLSRCTWGSRDPVRIRHPLSRALPILSTLLDMRSLELPGDRNMPRVQSGAFGASERFAVTPGREAQGYLHIAGGQSGHPLSPYYRAGFTDWAEGRASPFLPGATQHRLTLRPR